jgi:Flp pilus assembly protein TadB
MELDSTAEDRAAGRYQCGWARLVAVFVAVLFTLTHGIVFFFVLPFSQFFFLLLCFIAVLLLPLEYKRKSPNPQAKLPEASCFRTFRPTRVGISRIWKLLVPDPAGRRPDG